MTGEGPGPTDPRALAGERLAEYADLWRTATTKLTRGDYHAEDLVDDWFRWVGMVARDSTAAASVVLGGCPGPARGAGDEPER